METTFLNSERYLLHSFPKSSNLAFAKYDVLSNILQITFQNGSQYQYYGILEDIYKELIESESSGTYFNTVIKKFKYEKIK